jgi:hypothetical protein
MGILQVGSSAKSNAILDYKPRLRQIYLSGSIYLFRTQRLVEDYLVKYAIPSCIRPCARSSSGCTLAADSTLAAGIRGRRPHALIIH